MQRLLKIELHVVPVATVLRHPSNGYPYRPVEDFSPSATPGRVDARTARQRTAVTAVERLHRFCLQNNGWSQYFPQDVLRLPGVYSISFLQILTFCVPETFVLCNVRHLPNMIAEVQPQLNISPLMRKGRRSCPKWITSRVRVLI
jgi:hypothetical protein